MADSSVRRTLAGDSSITLYHSYLSPTSAAVERAIRHLGLHFVNGPPLRSATVSRWGLVANREPLIAISGIPYFDVVGAYQAIGTIEPSKTEQSARDRARENLLADWTQDTLFWAVMAERWSSTNSRAAYAQVVGASSIPGVLRTVAYPFVVRGVQAQLRAQGFGRLCQASRTDYVGQWLASLEAMLVESRYLMGDTPGVSDFLLASLCSFATAGPSPRFAEQLQHCRRITEHYTELCRQTSAPFTNTLHPQDLPAA